jgi:hypothetical protein
MASIGGGLLAGAIADANDVTDPDKRRQIFIAGALMPSPLLSAIVASALSREGGSGRDLFAINRAPARGRRRRSRKEPSAHEGGEGGGGE